MTERKTRFAPCYKRHYNENGNKNRINDISMETKMTIRGVRGTIFMPQVKPNVDVIKELGEAFPDWIPSIENPDLNIRDKIVSPSGQWMLIAPDNNERIVFTPQKVDYLSFSNAEYSLDEMNKRMQRCKEVFLKLIAITKYSVTRIAFAPAFVINIKEKEYNQWIASIFSRSQFKVAELVETNFTQTFYVEEKIGDRKIVMNYISKLETERYVQNVKGINQIVPIYTIEFDINTRTNEAHVFNKEEIEIFCSEAPRYGESFLNFYLMQ